MDKSIFTIEQARHGNILFELIVSGFNGAYVVRDVTDDRTAGCFDCDMSRGWETMRHDYQYAARYYNSLVPNDEAIPLF